MLQQVKINLGTIKWSHKLLILRHKIDLDPWIWDHLSMVHVTKEITKEII